MTQQDAWHCASRLLSLSPSKLKKHPSTFCCNLTSFSLCSNLTLNSNMSQTLLVRGEPLTLEEALAKETNILQELSFPQKRREFAISLFRRRVDLERLVALHLGIPSSRCALGKGQDWMSGSFNWCVPFDIKDADGNHEKNVLLRFPLPYKIGESFRPGNAEEKLRCEAATYLWLQEHCADIPIATLRGFGFPSGESVSLSWSGLSSLSNRHCSFRAPQTVLCCSVPIGHVDAHSCGFLDDLSHAIMCCDNCPSSPMHPISCSIL